MNDFQKLLKNYQRKLTNLSGSNKSLVQLRLSSAQDIDLDTFDFLNNISSFQILQNLIEGKRSITLCKELDPRNTKTNDASKRLRNIKRKNEFLFNERGAQDLYIGWPYVEGKLSNGSPVRCPLLYFPVEIALVGDEWKLKTRKDIPITFNQTFLLAYSFFNDKDLNEELLDYTFSDFDKDIIIFRTKLYELLKNSPLEINFNQNLFGNRLDKFIDYRKEDYSKAYDNGIIKLQPYAVLGIFPQAGSYLIPDYENLLEKSTHQNLEELFSTKFFTDSKAQSNFSYNYLNKIKEEHIVTPLPLDASQENALKALKEGHSLVIQGPPGTGKSQLICNIVSDYVARGKRVLVVCQKRVALDVVYNRLKAIDLAPFAALVHDFKTDRSALYNQINEQIENLTDYQNKNNGYNSIHLEREFTHTSRHIDQLLEQLEHFRSALFNEKEYGLSVKELYLTSDKANALIDLTQQYKNLTYHQENLFEKKLRRILPYQERFTSSHTWFNRVDFSTFELIDQENIRKTLQKIPRLVDQFNEDVQTIFGHPITFTESFWLLSKKAVFENILILLAQPQVYNKFQLIIKQKPDKEWLMAQEQQIDQLYRDIGIEASASQETLGNFLSILQKAIEARATPLKKIWWHLFNKDKYYIKRVLVANNLPWNNKGFKRLVQRIDNRLNLEHKLSLFNETPWLTDIPKRANKEAIIVWMNENFQAIECLELFTELKQYAELFGFKELTFKEVERRILSFEKTAQNFKIIYQDWLKYFTKVQIDKIITDKEYATVAELSIQDDFDDLSTYDKIIKNLTTVEAEVLDKLNNLEEHNANQKIKILKDSNHLSWINHLEKKYPVLKIVSTEEIKHVEEELHLLIEKKRVISKDILLLKVREQTYQNLQFNRLNNRTTYRDLQHQVTKKRRIWPLRKTLTEFYDDVFNLVPCWLASPEAVSSIFPLGQIFDLVIFDEASQCFAEKSIPALERGRQIVISGDAQQLSPNDLYQVRWEEENDNLIDLEKDSLLDLATQYLPQVLLKGHYRSKYLELIDFSNRHFYKNKLQLLPYATDLDSHKPPIKYVYLENGMWENNSNLIEANHVITIIEQLLKGGQASIGVITFNYKQQNLLEDLLDEFVKKNQISIPDQLFIKNIENVQGDEREHIIFSIGYGKNKAGKLVMNFGMLNQEHGEKRLNVAITRAKSNITIVSSILPHELNTTEAKHKGPKLFKEYLAYCLNISNGHFQFEQENRSLANKKLLKRIIKGKLKDELDISEIPFADLRISSDTNKLILTDDENYYNAISCKEAHITTPTLLDNRSWKISRIYSRNFWLNREKFYMNIKK